MKKKFRPRKPKTKSKPKINEDKSSSSSEEDDDDDNDDEQLGMFSFQIESITFEVSFSQLCQHSITIADKYKFNQFKELFPKDINNFRQQNNINLDNISQFFNYFKYEKVGINEINLQDLLKLSEYYQVTSLNTELNRYVDSIITNLLNYPEETDEPQLVLLKKLFGDSLSDCFQSDGFRQLPIPIIYRIIQNCDKNQIPNDLLFDFIKYSIDRSYSLLHFFDFEALSYEKFLEFFDFFSKNENYSEYLNQIPFNL